MRAKQFLREFYPSLDGRAQILIHEDQGLLLELDHPHDKPSQLSAYFAFDGRTRMKELVIMSALGSTVSEKYDAFVETCNQHPVWSNADIAAAFDEAGARFGPNHKADFVRSMPLNELRPYVGHLELVSVEFIPKDGEASNNDQSAILFWAVRARTHGPKTVPATYLLNFEPFEGRIMNIFRIRMAETLKVPVSRARADANK